MKELFVPGSSLLPPALFSVQGIRMQKNLFKASETEALWFITIRALKQSLNTKFY